MIRKLKKKESLCQLLNLDNSCVSDLTEMLIRMLMFIISAYVYVSHV